MIVNCRNGLEIESNPYVEPNSLDGALIKIGIKNVPAHRLPTIQNSEFTIRYLPFANLIYVVLEEPTNYITRIYVLEQELVNNEVKIKNYYSTIIVDCKNTLCRFFRYDEGFERDNVVHCLCGGLSIELPYAISSTALRSQLEDLLKANKQSILNPIAESEEKPEEKPEEPQMTQSIRELAKEHGIAYNTLWGRIRNRHMTVEEALAVGNTRAKVTKKKKHPDVTYQGKNLRELSEETGISYPKLWDRVHRQGRTVEEALAMGNKTKK